MKVYQSYLLTVYLKNGSIESINVTDRVNHLHRQGKDINWPYEIDKNLYPIDDVESFTIDDKAHVVL